MPCKHNISLLTDCPQCKAETTVQRCPCCGYPDCGHSHPALALAAPQPGKLMTDAEWASLSPESRHKLNLAALATDKVRELIAKIHVEAEATRTHNLEIYKEERHSNTDVANAAKVFADRACGEIDALAKLEAALGIGCLTNLPKDQSRRACS
jgi:hypothetical protein